MSSWWTACDYCFEWMMVYDTQDFDFDQEGIYCADCWRWWHVEICWPATMDCMLMLATKSLQDNPKSDVPYSLKKAYGIHCMQCMVVGIA